MRGGFTICTATCGSGVPIGMGAIRRDCRSIRLDRALAPPAWSAVGRGTIPARTAALRAASGARRRPGATSSASVSPLFRPGEIPLRWIQGFRSKLCPAASIERRRSAISPSKDCQGVSTLFSARTSTGPVFQLNSSSSQTPCASFLRGPPPRVLFLQAEPSPCFDRERRNFKMSGPANRSARWARGLAKAI